jgi:hypothetical protein
MWKDVPTSASEFLKTKYLCFLQLEIFRTKISRLEYLTYFILVFIEFIKSLWFVFLQILFYSLIFY